MPTSVSRRAYLRAVCATSPLALAGCLSSADGERQESSRVKDRNLNHAAEVKSVERVDGGLVLDVDVTAYFSCSRSAMADGALIDVVVSVDDEETHRDRWETTFSGCMDESTTSRRYRLMVGDYTEVAVETEAVEVYG